jgi:hypothetical protein
MESIDTFSFVSLSGVTSAARLGVDVDPYARAEKGVGTQVWYEGIGGAKWNYCGKQVDIHFGRAILPYPSPDLRFVVVIFHDGRDPPNNALVLNADGSVRHYVRQPACYAGRKTEFLDAWWYYRDIPQPEPPWWVFWRKSLPPKQEIRMKMLVGGQIDLPNLDFAALDFDPETGEFGEMVDFGRL